MHQLSSLVVAVALLVPAATAQAQSAAPRAPQGPGQSMLVLDASGSMWGQIAGRAKIEIAREAVGSMLATWPASQQLGLMAYGHRSKGRIPPPSGAPVGALRAQEVAVLHATRRASAQYGAAHLRSG